MTQLQPKTLFIFLLLALGIFFLDGQKVLETPKAIAQVATAPEQYLLYSLKQGAQSTFSFLVFWRSGEARIKNLEWRVMELSAVKNRAEALEKENAELRKQLGTTSLKGHRQLPAVVLGLSRYLEIGVGTDQGVAVGQTVVYGDNLVGRVVRLSAFVSFVQLPRDPESKIAVRVGGVRGLVKGEFNTEMNISQVAQNEELKTGDLVFTSGEGATYLPGMVVGKLGGIQTDQTGLFKQAEVTPLVDYSTLTTVFVVSE